LAANKYRRLCSRAVRCNSVPPDAHAPVHDVDFQIAEPKERSKCHSVPIGPTHEGYHAGDELLWGEGHHEDVVHSSVERRQLGFEVAASRQRDHGWALALNKSDEAFQDAARLGVHVEDDEVGLPFSKRRRRVFVCSDHAGYVLAVTEGKLHI
jgi:hypothetical protein